MRVRVLSSYAEVPASAWNALAQGNPFVEHAFLSALEAGGDAERADWAARPVIVEDDAGQVIAAAPAWKRNSSMGEFVYDFALAEAAERAGYRWYPKLVVAVPFTPVSGPRLLGAADTRAALLDGLSQAAQDCAGVHVLFPLKTTPTELSNDGFVERVQYQYHWHNEGWKDFDAWLRDSFTSKDRCEIRRERRRAAEGLSITVDDAPTPELLLAIGQMWARSVQRFGGWGNAWISPETFQRLGESWPERMQVIGAWDGPTLVAATWNVRGPNDWYGRVWACAEERRFLHFELCYYRAVQACIERGIRSFEPGHGGEHKARRGFRPTVTVSAHRLTHPGLHAPVADWMRREATAVRAWLAAQPNASTA